VVVVIDTIAFVIFKCGVCYMQSDILPLQITVTCKSAYAVPEFATSRASSVVCLQDQVLVAIYFWMVVYVSLQAVN